MKNFFVLTLSVLLFCTIAQGLVCNVCKFKWGHLCFKSAEPCKAKEGQFCETTRVYLGVFPFYTKYGCGEHRELCNTIEQRHTAFRRNYRRTCCDTDLCNGD